jgi:hypothetical protein
MTDMEAAAVISIACMKRQAVNRHGDLGGWLARAFHEAGQPVLLAGADPDRSALDRAGRAGGFPFRMVHLPRRDLDKRIAGYTRPDDLVITGCGQLEDHAGIARAVPGSRGSGLSAERDAPPWCCVLLDRTAANAQLNGRGPAGPGGGRVHGARHDRAAPGAIRAVLRRGRPDRSGLAWQVVTAGVASRASWQRQCGEGQRAAGDHPGPGAGHDDTGSRPVAPARRSRRGTRRARRRPDAG